MFRITITKSPTYFNIISLLNPTDRIRLNNITHCYEQYTDEPSISKYQAPSQVLSLRLHDFYNRKKPIIINLINYFKHLPDFQQLDLDDQVFLLKHNLHLLLPINYALLKTPKHSQVRYTYIQTIGCLNNINLHSLYTYLSNKFVPFVTYDPLIIKLFLIILFFTTNCQIKNSNQNPYKQNDSIKSIKKTYIELLWLYMIEKYGEYQARYLLISITMNFLHLQTIINQIEEIICVNNDIQHLDLLIKSVLRLT